MTRMIAAQNDSCAARERPPPPPIIGHEPPSSTYISERPTERRGVLLRRVGHLAARRVDGGQRSHAHEQQSSRADHDHQGRPPPAVARLLQLPLLPPAHLQRAVLASAYGRQCIMMIRTLVETVSSQSVKLSVLYRASHRRTGGKTTPTCRALGNGLAFTHGSVPHPATVPGRPCSPSTACPRRYHPSDQAVRQTSYSWTFMTNLASVTDLSR